MTERRRGPRTQWQGNAKDFSDSCHVLSELFLVFLLVAESWRFGLGSPTEGPNCTGDASNHCEMIYDHDKENSAARVRSTETQRKSEINEFGNQFKSRANAFQIGKVSYKLF